MVGNAGVLGAILIILLAVSITLCTALSMASMTTNIRIGRGGAFSIISQSLGLEVGGSIGLPLYFSQAFAVAMYVFGFREGVEWLITKVAADPESVLILQHPWIINLSLHRHMHTMGGAIFFAPYETSLGIEKTI